MKLTAEKPNKKFDYVLKDQRVDPNDPKEKQAQDKKDQVVFHMRALGSERVQVANFDENGSRLAYIIIMGLTGWSNARHADGTDAVFPKNEDGDCDANNIVEMFPKHWIELANAIAANSSMTGDEIKN